MVNRYLSKSTIKIALLSMASCLVLAGAPIGAAYAQTSAAVTVNVPAQPLGSALVEISDVFGVSILAADDLVNGKTSSSISGSLDLEDALEKALQGTGLKATRSRSGAFVIGSVPAVPVLNKRGSQSLGADTVIVTGTKQNLSIQDIQTSVTVFTKEQIEERALFNLEDIVLRTPNLSTGGGSLNDISIRGISFQGVGGAGGGVTGNIYVDGAPSSFGANQGALNLWDVEQVEALRGPQSTVQGRNALAGAIVLQTADPEYDFGADGRVILGNENTRQYSGVVTGPIIADQVAFRLSADYREVDFEVINQLDGRDARFQEGLTLRGKLLFEPKALEDLRLEITGEYTETDSGDLNVVSAPVPVSDPTFGDFDPFGNETFASITNFFNIQTTRFIADLDYQVGNNWSVKALGTYEEGDSERDLGIGGLDSNVFETYTAELRANFEYDGITGWFGGYFFDSSLVTTRVQDFPSPFPLMPADTLLSGGAIVDSSTENYAVFGDVNFTLTDKLSINLGARYDWETFTTPPIRFALRADPPDCIIAPSFPNIGGEPCVEALTSLFTPEGDLSSDFEAFLPRGSIIYDFDDDRSVSFNISRGYRAGGVFLTTTNGETFIGEFDPEYLTNYEFAFRNEWPDAGVTVNANIFYSDWTDQQVSLPGIGGNLVQRFILNAGESELYGAEFSAQAEMTSKLSLFANMGVLWTEFIDFPFAVDDNGDPLNSADPQFANLDGNRFDNSPRFNGAAGVTYQGDQGLFGNANISYSSSQFSDVLNLPENRGDVAFLVNARVGYDFGEFIVAAFVDNLFDDRVVLNRNTVNVPAQTGVLEEVPNPNFTVNDPRLWGLELRVRF
ncbi:MAG: TonB-dependent receptor [Pseudomonadota bacterium]